MTAGDRDIIGALLDVFSERGAAVLLGLVSSLQQTVGAGAEQTGSLAARIVALLQRAFPPAAPSG